MPLTPIPTTKVDAVAQSAIITSLTSKIVARIEYKLFLANYKLPFRLTFSGYTHNIETRHIQKIYEAAGYKVTIDEENGEGWYFTLE